MLQDKKQAPAGMLSYDQRIARQYGTELWGIRGGGQLKRVIFTLSLEKPERATDRRESLAQALLQESSRLFSDILFNWAASQSF